MRVVVNLVVVALVGSSTVAAFQPVPFTGVRRSSSSSRLHVAEQFTVGVLGDLHIDPRKMEDYVSGKAHWMPIFAEAKATHGNVALVSLGDLGESKNCDHNEANPSELFAGTTICHKMAAEYLGSFGVPYEVVGGNHGTCNREELVT